MAKTTSDHVPVNVRIGSAIPRANIFRFENYWLQHSQFKDIVQTIWSQEVNEKDSAKIIAAKFKRLSKGLKIWSTQISNLRKTIDDTNFLILCYDNFEEYIALSIEFP